MPDKPKHTLELFLAAIRGSRGIKSAIAERLGVNRHTVDNYLDRWATAKTAYDEERSLLNDMAESVVVLHLTQNSLAAAKFVLQLRGSPNGWQKSLEIEGEIDHKGHLNVSGIIANLGLSDLASLEDDELENTINKLLEVQKRLDSIPTPELDGGATRTDGTTGTESSQLYSDSEDEEGSDS